MINIQIMSALLDIASKAIAVSDLEAFRKEARSDLDQSYIDWKKRHGIERVERDTLDWTRMMVATKAKYEDFEIAKTSETNGRRRLATALRKYRTLSERIFCEETYDPIGDSLIRRNGK